MEVGVIYPQNEMRGDPRAVEAIGRAVEELGFNYITMFDHVAGAVLENRTVPMHGPFSYKDSFHEPLVTLGYLSGITKSIGLATGVLVMPQRQTLLVARQTADVDLLSGGRLRLDLGAGWNPVEFEALGQDFKSRGKRFDEQIGYLRKLWNECPLTFDGRFDKIDRAGLNPLPMRQIPIYIGGASKAAYQRAARLGDGFVFSGSLIDRVMPGWELVRQFMKDEGRAIEGFGAEYLVPEPTVDGVIDAIRRWEDLGGTHAAVRTMGFGFSEIQQHVDYLAEVSSRFD